MLNGICFTVSAQLSNAGFEAWDSASVVNGVKIYNPLNWYSRNTEMVGIGKTSPVSLTTDAHTGSYAVKITTKLDDGDKSAGMLASGNNPPGEPSKSQYEDKFKLTGRIKSYSGWYKYTPASAMDSFVIMIAFYRNGQSYGSAYYTGGATSVYKQFVWALTYPDNIPMADSARFLVYSSSYQNNTGTELILDDMDVQYKTPTGIDEVSQTSLVVYPNPVTDRINLFGVPPKIRAIIIANSQGIKVKELLENEGSVDVSDLEQGFYWLILEDENGIQSTVKFSKV